MMSPASAPSRPACHESSARTQWPCSKSKAAAPRYHTFPSSSWAYQSDVRSEGWPLTTTTAATTRAPPPRPPRGLADPHDDVDHDGRRHAEDHLGAVGEGDGVEHAIGVLVPD